MHSPSSSTIESSALSNFRISRSQILHMDPSLQPTASSVFHRIGGIGVVLCMPSNTKFAFPFSPRHRWESA
ncbi:hypothetical protein QR680_016674 [Steinernema hermaphroditum]|uniref:Uncharacterized protein n=1 Tax=Steinernema hermaphroditum TaxID=289476 RepID=A0AA39LMU2_9BILA|nr:hypothetical protein QR680_016674 [Steinernema hermaphroditum]